MYIFVVIPNFKLFQSLPLYIVSWWNFGESSSSFLIDHCDPSWGMLCLILLKLFFIAVFLAMVNFTCPEAGCKASFPTIWGLNQHFQTCIYSLYSQDNSSFLDRDSALACLNEKWAQKCQKLNPPDENQASSSTSIEHSDPSMSQID